MNYVNFALFDLTLFLACVYFIAGFVFILFRICIDTKQFKMNQENFRLNKEYVAEVKNK